MITINIEYRSRSLVNTDPQRRCYHGAHFSSALVWGAWLALESNVVLERVADRLKFWRELNADAVRARGPEALTEFKATGEFREPGTGAMMRLDAWYIISDSGSVFSPEGYATAEEAERAAITLPEHELTPADVSVWRPENAAHGFAEPILANVVLGLDMLLFWLANDSETLWETQR